MRGADQILAKLREELSNAKGSIEDRCRHRADACEDALIALLERLAAGAPPREADERYWCPVCDAECDRCSVDIGVGVEYGPWGCASCGWSSDPRYNMHNRDVIAADGSATDQWGVRYPPNNSMAYAYRLAEFGHPRKEAKLDHRYMRISGAGHRCTMCRTDVKSPFFKGCARLDCPHGL